MHPINENMLVHHKEKRYFVVCLVISIVVYAEIFERIATGADDILEFVITPELAHLKRRHVTKHMKGVLARVSHCAEKHDLASFKVKVSSSGVNSVVHN